MRCEVSCVASPGSSRFREAWRGRSRHGLMGAEASLFSPKSPGGSETSEEKLNSSRARR